MKRKIMVLVVTLAACRETQERVAEPPVKVGQSCEASFTTRPADKYDLLFVVDNSPLMAAWRDHLASGFPEMMANLEKLPNGLPDVRIGVISGDLGAGGRGLSAACARPDGDDGQFLVDSACADETSPDFLQPGARWIEHTWDDRTNFSGRLDQVFSCLASHVGQSGCEVQQPLAAALRALERGDFLRSDATLVLVFITAQDDCSLADPITAWPAVPAPLACASLGHQCGVLAISSERPFSADLATCTARADSGTPLLLLGEVRRRLAALKPRGREQIEVVVTGGWPEEWDVPARYEVSAGPSGLALQPLCSAGEASAFPVLRLGGLLDGDDLGWSLCSAGLGDFTQRIGERFPIGRDPPCLPGPLADVDPNQPGTQIDCSLVMQGPGTAETEQPIPRCTSTNGQVPCWEEFPDAFCPSGMTMVVWLGRESDGIPVPLPPQTTFRFICLCSSTSP